MATASFGPAWESGGNARRVGWVQARSRERISDVKRDQKRRGRFLGGYVRFGFDAVAPGKTNAHGLPI